MLQIIDRRFGDKNKSAVNRERFIERFKKQIRQSVVDAIAKRSITNIDKGEKIFIPAKDLSEPHFIFGEGGRREYVHPYNKAFNSGDKIPRPPQSDAGGEGAGGSPDPRTGTDSFGFELSGEEFLNIFFEDLSLPDLIKKQLFTMPEWTTARAGYKKTGTPATLNIRQTMRQSLARRIILTHAAQKELAEAEKTLAKLEKNDASLEIAEISALYKKIDRLKHKVNHVPYLDDMDLRFNNIALRSKLSTQAVMFCLMDVSGSMDETRKELAKKFFILLYLFLTRHYQAIDLVFIRHHTTAIETDEQTFFYSRETGGTVVSSALELMLKIIEERYPPTLYNIYAAQASDGDNWIADSPHCGELLANKILPLVQYYAYIEILPTAHQSLWQEYERLQKEASAGKHLAMRTVSDITEIYPVFHDLFKRGDTQNQEGA